MIGIIDIDSKIPNLALMKISNYYKSLGEQVEWVQDDKQYEKIYASAIFTKSYDKCLELKEQYGSAIDIGGTGYSLSKDLPLEIENSKPDYDLYTKEILYKRINGMGSKESRMKRCNELVIAGIGYTSRGCVRNCPFCFVPKKEGAFRQAFEIKDIINPNSNIIILHDNNLTADPYCIDKLHEIRDRKLIVDINQGCDVRLMNEDIAKALSEVKHLRSLHYAWDLMGFENQVIKGIKTLKKYIKPYKHMCFMLVGFNTNWEEDMYRFWKLRELGIDPFVMIYNQNEKGDKRLQHFARWVNRRIYKKCNWNDYEPWIKYKEKLEGF